MNVPIFNIRTTQQKFPTNGWWGLCTYATMVETIKGVLDEKTITL